MTTKANARRKGYKEDHAKKQSSRHYYSKKEQCRFSWHFSHAISLAKMGITRMDCKAAETTGREKTSAHRRSSELHIASAMSTNGCLNTSFAG